MTTKKGSILRSELKLALKDSEERVEMVKEGRPPASRGGRSIVRKICASAMRYLSIPAASVSLFLLGAQNLAGEPAVIEVKASRPVAFSTLKPSARVNANRDYTFAEVPKQVQGLAYVLHNHRAPAEVTARVKARGEISVCLVEGLTPAKLKLAGDWREIGRMDAMALGRPYPGKIYSRTVAKGETLVIPSGNQWGSVVLAKGIEGVPALSDRPAAGAASTRRPGEFGELQRQIAASARWNRERLREEVFRQESLILETDKTPVDIVLRRTTALLGHLKKQKRAPVFDQEAIELGELRALHRDGMSIEDQVELFGRIAALRRRIVLKNPLLDFDRLLFLKHHRSTFNHMCDQYYGHFSVPGGGLFVLENPFGDNPQAKSLLAGSTVQNGRLKGRKLEGGSFISLELDYDAETILFAWTEGSKAKWTPEGTYHVFKCNADGSGLTQLTDGPWNEFDPCVLPNGRIAFVSERIGGFLRCGRYCPTYTIHGMMPDGSDIIHLSFHDTHEWHPSVDNAGMLVYTRWDYVDRDSDIAHHIWHSFPDGRNPRSYHGNYPERRESRPWMEMSIRAVPGSHKYIAVAAPHHGQAYGSVVMIDLHEHDDRSMSQLKRVTPEVPFPESECAPGVPHVKGVHSPRAEVYGTAWPLSEDYFICVYDSEAANHGIYLVDSFGNKEPLYRDPGIACLDPIPFRPRTRPPVIPTATVQAKADRAGDEDLSMGTVTVMNVYESEEPWPAGTKIKELRIINLFSKATPAADVPRTGHADQSLARGVLGTVPVEEDGSIHFRMPTGVPFYMQALDENGLCVQNMRSATYMHPGETLGCIGCHEPKNAPPKTAGTKVPLAMKRPPSEIRPEAEGSYPLTFPRLVQPVLDAKCVSCHDKEKKAPSLRGDRFAKHGWSEAFHTLQKYAWGRSGGNGALHTKNGNKSYSVPGKDGARVSKLYAHLTRGHHDVKLTPKEMRRITLWMDCNSNFYGAYLDTGKQARGEVVKPTLATPPWMDFDDLVR